MTLLEWFPSWAFMLALVVGVIVFLVSQFMREFPVVGRYAVPISFVAVLMIAFGSYMSAVGNTNYRWEAEIAIVKGKLALAEVASGKENVRIVETTVVKTEVVKQRGRDVIKYIDREYGALDARFSPGGVCEIPSQFIQAHNAAAKGKDE